MFKKGDKIILKEIKCIFNIRPNVVYIFYQLLQIRNINWIAVTDQNGQLIVDTNDYPVLSDPSWWQLAQNTIFSLSDEYE
jgi:hypothetical protein